MLLLCVAIALITFGFVVPCVIDVARTPSEAFDLPAKQTWLVVVVAFWAFGALAWLLVGRRDVHRRQMWTGVPGGRAFGQRQALQRHPSGQPGDTDYLLADALIRRPTAALPSRFVAPDDNPDFLLELDRMIRDWREDA